MRMLKKMQAQVNTSMQTPSVPVPKPLAGMSASATQNPQSKMPVGRYLESNGLSCRRSARATGANVKVMAQMSQIKKIPKALSRNPMRGMIMCMPIR